MPKVGNRIKTIDFLVRDCINQLINCENSDEEDEVLDESLEDLSVVISMRYSVPFRLRQGPHFQDWVGNVLPSLDDAKFKTLMRVSRDQFSIILNEIKDDPLFSSQHSKKQFPIELQLAILLYRLGTSGEEATIVKTAALFRCGTGGTVDKITKRIMQVILRKKWKFLNWPKESERQELVAASIHELPQCVGYLGGTEVTLADKPTRDADIYSIRDQKYAIMMQAVCDCQLKIRHLVVGAPTSAQKMFENSSLCQQPCQHFTGEQWLAADHQYNPSPIVISPFKGEEITERQIEFNTVFSSYRARIEHCFNVLKETFNSLKELKININSSGALRYASEWITVCCILHNMIIDSIGLDEIHELVQSVDTEQDDEEDEEEEVQEEDPAGTSKRNALMEKLLK